MPLFADLSFGTHWKENNNLHISLSLCRLKPILGALNRKKNSSVCSSPAAVSFSVFKLHLHSFLSSLGSPCPTAAGPCHPSAGGACILMLGGLFDFMTIWPFVFLSFLLFVFLAFSLFVCSPFCLFVFSCSECLCLRLIIFSSFFTLYEKEPLNFKWVNRGNWLIWGDSRQRMYLWWRWH